MTDTNPSNTDTSNPTDLRLMIVDDQPLVREGLAKLIELEGGVEVVAQAEHGQAALDALAAMEPLPDVVLMDVKMPVMGGIEAARQMVERYDLPVVLLTTFEDVEDIAAGLNAGVAGYLFKSVSVEEIVDAVQKVHAGHSVIHPRVSQMLAQFGLQGGAAATEGEHLTAEEIGLTPKELEVIALVHAGQSNKQIGNTLGVTEGTVKIHMNRIMSKMNVKSRTEAAVLAIRVGLVEM